MLLSVINNQFPSFLQQNQYLILALYHYNVLNYFVRCLAHKSVPHVFYFSWKYITKKHSKSEGLQSRKILCEIGWLHRIFSLCSILPEECLGTSEKVYMLWKLHLYFTNLVLQGTEYLQVPEVLYILSRSQHRQDCCGGFSPSGEFYRAAVSCAPH